MEEKGNAKQKIDLALLDPVLEKKKREKGTLIPILQAAQEIYGYLPEEVIKYISSKINIPLSRVYGVITFYAQFYQEPRGKYIIKLCQGTACHVKGGKGILEEIERRLEVRAGETTEDLLFTLETVACLGTCFLAPVQMVNDQYHGKLSPRSAVKVLEKIRKAEVNL
ncbi:MAG: NADH-quinone oxidoreductase subunit NuoE [Deltaproteobacteria bacterium]|nr:NADH-quinone oxidoreductase subunit NuoE [Deltaproteobacteria bacterium]